MRDTPLFLYHGLKDKHIPVEPTKRTYEYFQNIYNGDQKRKHHLIIHYDHDLEHGIGDKELAKLGSWVSLRFKIIMPLDFIKQVPEKNADLP